MTNLKDLSRHLGLSVTQVSRALNDHTDVAQVTKERVREAANALGYRPNISARRLQAGRSGIVGVVLTGVPRPSVGALYMRVFGGMSAHFWRHGMQFVMHMADPEEDIIAVYRRLIEAGSMDGFILFDPIVDDPRIAFLLESKVPFVLHGREAQGGSYPFFDIDNRDVGYRLTRHLLEAGHRRIGFLNGIENLTFVRARLAGHRAALDEAGIDFDPLLYRTGEQVEGRGIADTIRLFDDAGRAPTAMIAGNAFIAQGIYIGLKALGLTVPDDVSVVAHDDMLPEVRLTGLDPAVTATQSPLEHSWKPLAESLVGAIEGRAIGELQEAEAIEFIVRNSVAPPRATR